VLLIGSRTPAHGFRETHILEVRFFNLVIPFFFFSPPFISSVEGRFGTALFTNPSPLLFPPSVPSFFDTNAAVFVEGWSNAFSSGQI